MLSLVKHIILLLGFLLSVVAAAQCPVGREVNTSFEERKFNFYHPKTNELIRSINLFQENPYNKLPFKRKSIDASYGMNIYHLSPAEAQEYSRQYLDPSSEEKIVYLNSQADVVIHDDCKVYVNYGLYRMSEDNEYLSCASTVSLYDASGTLMHPYSEDRSQLVNSVFSNDYNTIMSGTSSRNDIESIQAVDLTTGRKIFILGKCEEEMWSNPGNVQDSHLLIATLYESGSTSSDKTVYVFNPADRTLRYRRMKGQQMEDTIGFYPSGLVVIRGKGGVREVFDYVDDFEEIKINKY
ncbi:hypothetical protein QWY85_17010 [Neolewinella lacunae]|uniref:Uncharacterized protein n=1 Tax=Neolewinella lacunae TaxID=1517758 RepID=A0A923T878_9BACT|nr:hypothetical protein [Neolewinella lacunae]MBC6993673.1 hypothetical protein [Neolewinella lacunae]MDN3636368.1 hypothetical protein [Neolewinella lacunae]